jgi:lipopolysaccharide/colanic/teichoic acid biosynthesis glycosyltransferase
MIKRVLDILLSVLIILLGSPFIGIVLLIVFIITGENPLILQLRKITLNKNEIKIFKIRTLKSSKQLIELEKKSDNIFFKNDFDKYVPLFCKWLRKSGIDEVPQVINVVKGEMSLVGPRPFPLNDLHLLETSNPEYYYRRGGIKSKPGITGYWQVFGNRHLGTMNLIECDETYEKQKSIFLDLKIIFKTMLVLLAAKHSDAIVGQKHVNKSVYTPEEATVF